MGVNEMSRFVPCALLLGRRDPHVGVDHLPGGVADDQPTRDPEHLGEVEPERVQDEPAEEERDDEDDRHVAGAVRIASSPPLVALAASERVEDGSAADQVARSGRVRRR